MNTRSSLARWLSVSIALLAGACDGWISGASAGSLDVRRCLSPEYPSGVEILCPGGWIEPTREARSVERDLSTWRPSANAFSIDVEEHSGTYRVTTRGTLECRFETRVEASQWFVVPRGTRCRHGDEILRVTFGRIGGSGGLLAPTRVEATFALEASVGAVYAHGLLDRGMPRTRVDAR